jgi:ubiquinone/menaquinone biosynthesis C-methylase UbiE
MQLQGGWKMNSGHHESEAGIVGVFSRAAPTYDRVGPPVFAHFGQRLVDQADLASGAAVLDVAVGRGAALFPAGKRIGETGRVIGIDLSAAMVRETDAEIRNAGSRHIEIRQMDAEHLDFHDASFDRVLCGFALWFFPHPDQALREFFRVLKPGGAIGLTTWTEDCPFLTWCVGELNACLPAPAPRQGQNRFDTPARIEAALREAGFSGIEVDVEEADFVYANYEEWWLSLWSAGLRARLENLEAPVLDRVKSEMLQRVKPLTQPDGIHTLWRALLACARKPSE